mmetsp:Transcript_33701/g.107702  ORF Transcript_33701/g.107702 Transcript_33701/m.107702 type:complete len:440 (-) Transcript_33701:97-1416(-)
MMFCCCCWQKVLLLLFVTEDQILGAWAAGMLVTDSAEDAALQGIDPPQSRLVPPLSFSWRHVNGFELSAFLTPAQNQHVPVYCGACFSFGAYHCLQDRTKIARFFTDDDKWRAPDALVAHQVMLNCGSDEAGSCAKGGTAPRVWRWTRDFGGIPLAGCQPYEAVDGRGCAPENVCRNCMPAGGDAWWLHKEKECWAVPGDRVDRHPCEGDGHCATSPYPRIQVADFGALPSALDVGALQAGDAIMREITRGGPVTCDIDSTNIVDYIGDHVIEDPVGNRTVHDTNHVIEIVGWGTDEEGGKPYWEFRNSWGEYWGDAGFGKIYRGRNDMLIESRCYWVTVAAWGSPGTDRWQTNPSIEYPDEYHQKTAELLEIHNNHNKKKQNKNRARMMGPPLRRATPAPPQGQPLLKLVPIVLLVGAILVTFYSSRSLSERFSPSSP